MQHRIRRLALVLPGSDVRVVLVVALRLSLLRLVLLAEVTAARLVAVERVLRHQLAELEEIRHAQCKLEVLVQRLVRARDRDVVPELLAERRDLAHCLLQSLLRPRHADVVPHDVAEAPMEIRHRPRALDLEQLADLVERLTFGFEERRMVRRTAGWSARIDAGEVVAERVRNHEVAIRQTLHQRACAESVCAVIREVRLAEDEQPRDRRLQVIVDPQSAHGVVDSRVDPHRRFVRIFVRDPLVHLKQVAVARLDGIASEAVDRILEVEVDSKLCLADSPSRVALEFRGARGNVTRNEVAEARVAAFEIVVALVLGDVTRTPVVVFLLRNPHASVVSEALGHQRQLRLIIAGYRDARRMDLRKARVGEERAALVAAPRGGRVRVLRVRRQVVDVAVSAGREQDGVTVVPLDQTRDEVTRDDPAGLAVDDDQIEHLLPRVHLDLAGGDLLAHCLVGTEEELLAGLSARVERS